MTQAGDAEGLVFLGGGLVQGANAGVVDLDSSDDSDLNKPALAHLCSVLPDRFKAGDGATLKQAWTGIMGFTADGFPLVGRIPQALSNRTAVKDASGHEWIAAGFSGYGMVNCWQSGRVIADMISGPSTGTMDDSFPSDLFKCTKKRLESMTTEDLWSAFGPPSTRSRL
jgi:glycine/D-amino acid oxidase-like deaminating enzyme